MAFTPPPVIDFADKVQELLRVNLSNPGAPLDTGAGMDDRDIWVQHGGHEFLVTIRYQRELPKAA